MRGPLGVPARQGQSRTNPQGMLTHQAQYPAQRASYPKQVQSCPDLAMPFVMERALCQDGTDRQADPVWAARHQAWDQSAHVCVSAQVCAIGDACTGSLWTGARGGRPVPCHRACHWKARRRRSSPPPRPGQRGRMACSWSWGLRQGNLCLQQFSLQQHLAKGVRFEPFALQRLVIHGPGGEARLAGCKECLTPGAPPPHS